MPNHCINESIFEDVDWGRQQHILAVVGGASRPGHVDFEQLLPLPINAWRGGVSSHHEKTLPTTGLDWSMKNWGTKWNAYAIKPVETTNTSITFRFDTAWRPPYGWLVALLNTMQLNFTHNWLSEGGGPAKSGSWSYDEDSKWSDYNWVEETIPEGTPLYRHLHKLRWGVEEFPPDDEE